MTETNDDLTGFSEAFDATINTLFPKALQMRPKCEECRRIGSGFGPRHNGSRHCESGSIASGGDRAHCTCDTCF